MKEGDSKYTEEVLSRILAQSVQDFFFVDRTFVLYFGTSSGDKPLKTTYDLWIDCAWRVDDGKKIIAARHDDAESAKAALSKLKDGAVTDIEYEHVSHDLKVRFSNGLRLHVFTQSVMDKQWELRGANGYRYGIGPNLAPYEHVEQAEGFE